MAKYLDLTGLTTFWTNVKSWVAVAVTTNGPSASKTVTGWNEGKITYANIQISESQVTNLTEQLNAKAPLASPALTGTPTAPTAATGTNTTQIATTAFVNAEIDAKMGESDAMVYKGTIAGGNTEAYGALTPAANKGWTYKVTTAGKIDGVKVEIGDMLICNTDNTASATANNYSTIAENWDFIQGNQDGVVVGPSSATSGNVVLFDGNTGKIIKDSGKTLGKSVPSNAEFTDTKVTSVGGHYEPEADPNAALSAAASGATAAWSIDVVKAVQLQRDAKGHVVGITVTSGKLPGDPNTDTKVTQNSNSDNKEFPLLAKYTDNTTNETNTAKYAGGVTVNPSTKKITATGFIGNLEGDAATASAAKSGSALETAINSKADKVASATSGDFASLDKNGNLTDSGKKASDFATAAQGNKANTAIQGVKLAGAGSALTPDSNKVVTIPNAVASDTTGATNGLLSADDKKKLNGIADGAEVNQNAFSNVKVGSTTVAADSKTDTLELVASGATTITPDATNDKITISSTDQSVTAVGHHYTPATDPSAEKDASGGTATQLPTTSSTGSLVQVVTGVKMDAKGHVTGVVSKGLWSPNTTYSNASMGQGYGTCSTAEATAAKVVTLSNYVLATGGIVAVKFTYGLCANATLNIDSKGAKNVFINGAAVTSTTAKMVKAGDIAYFIYDGTQYQFLGTDRMEKDAITGLSVSGKTVTYTRSDGETGTFDTQDTTYSFADGYNASTNKGATVDTVTNAINALDVSDISGFGAGKTLATLKEENGKISATFQDISITKSQVSDFSHTHGNIQNGGTLQTNDITIANGDKLVVTDSSDSSKVARASIAFDGSTTTKALTPKGTFEAFAKSGDITTAIQALDVSSVGGDGKYISAISETDGKISATATTMDTTPTANSTKAVTSGGIKTALNGKQDSLPTSGTASSTYAINISGNSTSANNWHGSIYGIAMSANTKRYVYLGRKKRSDYGCLIGILTVCSHTDSKDVYVIGSGWSKGNFGSDASVQRISSGSATRPINICLYNHEITENDTVYSELWCYIPTNSGEVDFIFRTLFNFYGVMTLAASVVNRAESEFTGTLTKCVNSNSRNISHSPTNTAVGSASVPVYVTSSGAVTACTDDFVHDGDVTSTYSSTGTAPVNGKAVAAAIGGLDVSSVGGDGKYISAISETDGKISATATTMDTTPTANSKKAVTSGGIKAALDGKSSSSHAHDDRYIRAGSGNKSLSFGGTTTLGTVNGVNVNLVMPKANADTYDVYFGSTSFADALTAFNSNKKLILLVGKAGSGAYSTAYHIPLYRVQFNGNDITQFVWMLDSDAYGDASGSNTYGAIYIYKLSESGWSSSSDNVEYAKVAGTANGGVADYLRFGNNNEINFKKVPTSGNKHRLWFNYCNGDNGSADTNNPLTDYYFGDRKHGTDTTLHANRLVGSADKWNGWSIVVGSTGSDANTLYFV